MERQICVIGYTTYTFVWIIFARRVKGISKPVYEA
jgi:hypothetical protein